MWLDPQNHPRNDLYNGSNGMLNLAIIIFFKILNIIVIIIITFSKVEVMR